MKLFLIKQDKNTGYDTYDSAVVYAFNEEQARQMHPRAGKSWEESKGDYLETYGDIGIAALMFDAAWVKPEDVKVIYLGLATHTKIKPGVICSSYNAS